jgi:hypothetical protein
VDSRDILDNTTTKPVTKRQLLKTTARFYDPLGLFSPVSVVGEKLTVIPTGPAWEDREADERI